MTGFVLVVILIAIVVWLAWSCLWLGLGSWLAGADSFDAADMALCFLFGPIGCAVAWARRSRTDDGSSEISVSIPDNELPLAGVDGSSTISQPGGYELKAPDY